MFKFDETPRVMIIQSPYYEHIANDLIKGAVEVLDRNGAEYDIYDVPGVLEIPAMLKIAIRALSFDISMNRYDAYVLLGCVIRGETGHYDIVAKESARGIMNLVSQYSLALGNGILTVENQAQAEERADPNRKNKGGEAAIAALNMLMNKQKFGLFPRKVK